MINRDAASTLTSREDRINLQAAIISHQAQVLDNLGNPQKAAVVCQEEIDIRLGESPKKHILLAYSACNLGIMYSSANDFPKASEAFSASHRWWDLHFTSKGEVKQFAPSILVYEARGLIGLGKLKEAEEMIKETIKLVKEEKPLNFGSLAL
jgi:tetratricopeptide (TPR) repeat protein